MKLFLLITLYSSLCFGRQVRIAVLDSGLSQIKGVKLCENPIDLTRTTIASEFDHHGDNVTHIISDGLNDYCIYHLKVFSPTNPYPLYKAVYEAIRLKVDIINISGGGPGSDDHEKAAFRYAAFKHVIVIAAAGNESNDLDKDCNFYPACYESVISVGNIGRKSNYGEFIDVWMHGINVTAGGVTLSGTSQAAAMFTHALALRLEKL